MRIAFVTFEYSPSASGGAGTYAWNLAQELARLGHEVVVFSPGVPDSCNSSTSEGLTRRLNVVHLRCKPPFRALQFWIRLPRAVTTANKEAPFDIIHFNGLSYGFVGRRLTRAPNIVTVHHLVIDSVRATKTSAMSMLFRLDREETITNVMMERICLNSADSLIAVSEFTKRRIVEEYLGHDNRIHVVPNGVNIDTTVINKSELTALRNELGIRDRPVVFTVGRIDDTRKGLDKLVSAFSKVHKHVDAVLLIAGDGKQDGLRNQIQSLGLANDVRILGFVDNATLRKCYSIASVYATSSRLEGFGLTIPEAMAAGCVIVATNVGAIPELVRHGENGFLVPVDDVNSMALAIQSALNTHTVASPVISIDSSKQNTYGSWSDTARLTVEIYESLRNDSD